VRRRIGLGRTLAASAVVATAVLGTGPAARAQAPTPAQDIDGRQLLVQSFDGGGTRSDGRNGLDFVWTGEAADVAGLKVVENDHPVTFDGPPIKLTGDRGLVFVIDSGKGMKDAGVLPDVRDTILRVARQHPGLEYGVVQAGDRADIRADLTRDPARLASAVSSIGPTNGSAVWTAVSLAVSMFSDRERLQPNIVLVSADSDTVTPAAAPVARSAIVAGAVMLQSVVFTGQGHHIDDTEPYQALVGTQGGNLAPRTDRDALLSQLSGAVVIVADKQYTASWRSAVPDGSPVHLEVNVAGLTDTVDVLAGRGLYQGYQQLHPELGVRQATLPLTDNKVALALALMLCLAGVAGAAYALTTALIQDDLSNVLQPYADAYGLIEGDTGEREPSSLGRSAFVQRAVAFTEQVAENQGLLTRAEAALERANLPLRAGEALFVYAVVVLVLTLIPVVLTRNVLTGLGVGLLATLLPVTVVNTIAKRRRKSFLAQLPDTLSLLSGTMKAGYSLMQGVEAVSQEVTEPMGQELRRVITESRLGRPLEESLDASADRMDSPDFGWAVMAIRIQREVGGNLAELLLTVADTMVQRERLRRDVASLTAEGRVSAYMLAAMPPMLTATMYVLNKEYVSTLFTNGVGIAMVVVAILSMIIGFFWMKKIITIEI
jgi:tight adherence protein B